MKNVIIIKHPKNWGLSERQVLSSVNCALEKRGLNNIEIGVLFIGSKKAKDLNMKYRQKSYIPQVLGFPLSREVDGDGMIRLGDIIICTQKLKYEAKFKKKSIEWILSDWLLHGVDNLLIQ
jgi:rRNA maturation RNase YbeY